MGIIIILTQRAMSSVPSLTAYASSILALAMFRASWIARFLIAFRASPIIVAPIKPIFSSTLENSIPILPLYNNYDEISIKRSTISKINPRR